MTNEIISAVSLKYPKGADLPFVTAKGKGELAKKILDVAEQNHIPIEKNQEIVNILSAQEIGSGIPCETWDVLAIIFSSILERK